MRSKPMETEKVTIRLPKKDIDNLKKICSQKGTDVSKEIRNAIKAYLDIKIAESNITPIAEIIRQVIKIETDKQGDRLAKMMMKVGIISSANYFTVLRMISDVINPTMHEDFKDIHATARKMGINYMKLKDYDITSFMENDSQIDELTKKIKSDY